MADTPEVAHSTQAFDFEHNPTWRIFRIMSEFVDGFTFLARVQRSVTIFGSARLREGDPSYERARTLARRLAERGYAIVTGGGPGIMQAANQGAVEGNGDSVGLNIQLPHEQRINPYVRQGISFHYFFSRKVMLDFSAEAYVFFPGGFGTLDEFFELITLVQTGKLERCVPILLIGRDYWQPLIAWMETMLRDRLGAIAPADLAIWTLTDDLDEALESIETGVRTQAHQRLARTGHTRTTPDEKLRQATSPMAGTEQ
ncbi:MAG: TIGR00730 family Rossman fold protein [Ktedonobacterales bacterium]|nr:TIGR00730 family Rossman fold protein [Ktedonobacterales bacterium]